MNIFSRAGAILIALSIIAGALMGLAYLAGLPVLRPDGTSSLALKIETALILISAALLLLGTIVDRVSRWLEMRGPRNDVSM